MTGFSQTNSKESSSLRPSMEGGAAAGATTDEEATDGEKGLSDGLLTPRNGNRGTVIKRTTPVPTPGDARPGAERDGREGEEEGADDDEGHDDDASLIDDEELKRVSLLQR